MASAEIDHRTEALYRLGVLLNMHAGIDVKGINIATGDRDTAVITYNNGHQQRVNVACDSVTAAIRDVMKVV